MESSSAQGICVEVVKFEVSSDNGDDPMILPEATQLSPDESLPGDHQIMSQFNTDHQIQELTSTESVHQSHAATTSLSATTPESSTFKPVPPNSELIRLFGQSTAQPIDIDGNPILQAGSLASQFCPLGPKERCTPSQAQAMGEQILKLMATHENNNTPLPYELQNTFDIFHRCLAVAYGTFFLHLYTKANAPCVLCHGCKSLYPPGQYIHHSCLALPPNIVPCRSRMWRRCLVPLMSQDMNKTDQKERWKFVLEKFSHASMGVGKRNIAQMGVEPQLLEMPECKRGKFMSDGSEKPSRSKSSKAKTSDSSSVSTHNSSTGFTVQTQQQANTYTTSTATTTAATDTTTGNNGSSLLVDEDNTIYTCISDDEASGDVTLNERFNWDGSSRTIGIFKELVKEVNKLEVELSETKEKLKQANERLKAVTSGDSLSEQFVQSLLAQEKVVAEKKELAKKLQLEEEKSSKLEKQLNRIRLLHLEMQSQFKL